MHLPERQRKLLRHRSVDKDRGIGGDPWQSVRSWVSIPSKGSQACMLGGTMSGSMFQRDSVRQLEIAFEYYESAIDLRTNSHKLASDTQLQPGLLKVTVNRQKRSLQV